MILPRVVITLASLVSTPFVDAHGARIRHDRHGSPLEVTLTQTLSEAGSKLVVTITNAGTVDLNLLKVGTLLDEKLPVRRLIVVDSEGKELSFHGIHPSLRYDMLKASHFQHLKASETINVTIDVTNGYHFPEGGKYTVSASGLIPVAVAPSIRLSGPSATFKSNSVQMEIASSPVSRSLETRTKLQSGCNATQLEASTKALSNCVSLAQAAAADAANPQSERFVEYFKTNSSTTRQTVVNRLNAVAQECNTIDSGPSRYFCYDYYGVCEIDGPLNAYTAWDVSTVVMCPLFYDTLPPLPPGCHRQCQATTTIHEMTHCDDVFSPHTNDYAYAYNESVALPPERALLNADNYSLYANAVYMDC